MIFIPEEKQAFTYVAKTGIEPPYFTTYTGGISSEDPMTALEDIARSFACPSSLFSIEIRAFDRMAPESRQPLLARYHSVREHQTQKAALRGSVKWLSGGLYVVSKNVAGTLEVYEVVSFV